MFTRTTVDSILADFTKKIAALDTLIGKGRDNHVLMAQDVDRIRADIAVNDAEVKRAEAVRVKIAELVA